MKKIITSKAANEAAKKVSEFIKSGWKNEVEDTEILVYWEDGCYNINVRAYFKDGKVLGLNNADDYQIMKAMREYGILDAQAVLLQEDDGYKTYCGFSNYCDKEPETTIADIRRIFKGIKFTEDITARIATKNEPFPILYVQSNKKGLGNAVRSTKEAVKIFRTMVKGRATVRECWMRSTQCLPNVQQTCTHAYRITLV